MNEVDLCTSYLHAADILPRELEAIGQFMESDYPSFELPRGPRDGVFRIEVPKISESKEIIKLIQELVPDELQSCHPLLRRRNIFVRFVPELIVRNASGGNTRTYGDMIGVITSRGETKYYLRVTLNDLKRRRGDDLVANAIYKILHEIAETDYFLKSPLGTKDRKENFGTKEYFLEEDEAIANRRAVRALKRKFPDVKFTKVSYPEDKI